MSVIHPLWLWGLAGILIPVAIHLLSRKEGKVIRIGSLRHLQDTTTRQFKSIRLNEIFLLILRCLLIALVVLLLAEPLSFQTATDRLVVVDPALETHPQVGPLLDSLIRAGYEKKEVTSLTNAGNELTTNEQLVSALAALPIGEAVVIAEDRWWRTSAFFTELPPNIRWIAIEPTPTSGWLGAWRTTSDSVQVIRYQTQENSTVFSGQAVRTPLPMVLSDGDSIPIRERDTLHVQWVVDSSYQALQKRMQAAVEIIEKVEPYSIVNSDTQPDWIIWLSNREAPTTNVPLLLTSNISNKRVLQQVAPNRWTIPADLSLEEMARQHFTIRLAQVFSPYDLTARIDSIDRRRVPESMRWKPVLRSFDSQARTPFPVEWLLALVLILLITERYLSFKRQV